MRIRGKRQGRGKSPTSTQIDRILPNSRVVSRGDTAIEFSSHGLIRATVIINTDKILFSEISQWTTRADLSEETGIRQVWDCSLIEGGNVSVISRLRAIVGVLSVEPTGTGQSCRIQATDKYPLPTDHVQGETRRILSAVRIRAQKEAYKAVQASLPAELRDEKIASGKTKTKAQYVPCADKHNVTTTDKPVVMSKKAKKRHLLNPNDAQLLGVQGKKFRPTVNMAQKYA